MITLKPAPCNINRKKVPKNEAVLMCHDPINHWLGLPCIHIEKLWYGFERLTTRRIVDALTVEIIHHVLLDFGEEYDNAWERYHGTFFEAVKKIR